MDKDRLANFIYERRLQLSKAQADLQDDGGPSAETVGNYESGLIPNNPQDRTLEGFDIALFWQKGSARTVLDGGEPTPIDPAEEASISIGSSVQDGWVALPKYAIQNLAAESAYLDRITRDGHKWDHESVEVSSRIRSITSDLVALNQAVETGNAKLIEVMARSLANVTELSDD